MPGRWTCPHDHPVSGDHAGADVCPTCGADLVWRQDASAPLPRRTPAQRRAARARVAELSEPAGSRSGWGYIIGGLTLIVVGTLLVANGAIEDSEASLVLGWLVVAAGGTLNLVGIVAEGVRLGIGMARQDSRTRGVLDEE